MQTLELLLYDGLKAPQGVFHLENYLELRKHGQKTKSIKNF